MHERRMNRRAAVTLVELIVAVLILGLIAALAIPRLSRGGGDDRDERVRASLTTLRTAIALYHQHHDHYPGQADADRDRRAGTPEAVVAQLCWSTDRRGEATMVRGGAHALGPYLRDGVPASPLLSGDAREIVVIRGDRLPGFVAESPDAAWVYNCDTGYIAINSDRVGGDGVRFDRY